MSIGPGTGTGAGHEVGRVNQVGALDRPWVNRRCEVVTEPACGIVDKIPLGVQRRTLADDLHRISIGTTVHRFPGRRTSPAPRPRAPWRNADRSPGLNGTVVGDAHGEVPLRLLLVSSWYTATTIAGVILWTTGRSVRRSRGHRAARIGRPLFRQGRDDVLVQRLTRGAGFLGPVQHGDRLVDLGNTRRSRGVERAVQPHLTRPTFWPSGTILSIVSSTTPLPEAMHTITRSASGAPNSRTGDTVGRRAPQTCPSPSGPAPDGFVERAAGSRAWKKTSGFGPCREPGMFRSEGPLAMLADQLLVEHCRQSSSVNCSILFTSCEIRKPS